MKEYETLAHIYVEIIINYLSFLVLSTFDYKITLNSICKIQHYYYYIAIDCFHTYIGISFRSEHDKMANNARIGFFTTAMVYVSF